MTDELDPAVAEQWLVEVPRLRAVAARTALAAAVGHAVSLGVAACVVVVDEAGHRLAYERMDGAPYMSEAVAVDKARTAAAYGLATHDWWAEISDDPSVVAGLSSIVGFSILGGGVAVVHGDAIVGAVGVSGGSPEEDRQIAEAGIVALLA
jgi:uncharacterized protein GlcG (DUF336 family)